MPITLITGTPGAGKTLFALEHALKEIGVKDHSSFNAIKSQLLAPPDSSKLTRPLVVCGVEGLKPGLFVEMENPLDWEQFEDGTLFLVDEAWKWFGTQDKAVAKDERFLRLAEHRHRGMDFIMTTQAPSQIQQHVRALAGPHLHITRKFGTKLTMQYEWPAVQSSPNSPGVRKLAQERAWGYNLVIGEVYQSATMHTIKRKIPLKILMIPVILAGVLGCVGLAAWAATSFVGDGLSGARIKENGTLAKGVGGDAADDVKRDKEGAPIVVTREDYLTVRVPRVEGIPASAAIFDGRKVTAYPRMYCMANGYGGEAGCRCVTEQNSQVLVNAAMCQHVARWGGSYDEYREERREQRLERNRDDDDDRQLASEEEAGPLGLGEPGKQARYGQFRGEAQGPEAYQSSF